MSIGVFAIGSAPVGVTDNAEASVSPPRTATITLVDIDGTPASTLANLKWAWFDQATPDVFGAPTDKGSAELTDGSGVLTVALENSGLVSGQIGWLIVTNSNGSTAMVHKAFSGPVEVN